MDEVFAKDDLHSDLREVREVMLWKLEGLPEYDIRRPLTSTGTNLLGLVKHLAGSVVPPALQAGPVTTDQYQL
jgi:hypothetical protein